MPLRPSGFLRTRPDRKRISSTLPCEQRITGRDDVDHAQNDPDVCGVA